MGTCLLCRVTRGSRWVLRPQKVRASSLHESSPFIGGGLASIGSHNSRALGPKSLLPSSFSSISSLSNLLDVRPDYATTQHRRLTVFAKETPRPTLDDVERLSKGRPSKAKIGSRAVPHRLTAAERKVFDISKKKSFLVMRTNTRNYPLANTWRNFCEASGTPYIKIEQEPTGQSDTFYVDFSPMRQDPEWLEVLREACLAEAAKILNGPADSVSDPEDDESGSDHENDKTQGDLSVLREAQVEMLEADEYDQVSEGGYAFRLVCSRQAAKAIAKAVLMLASDIRTQTA